MDLGLDSLELVRVRGMLEEEFGPKLDATALFDYPNVPSLSRMIAQSITQSSGDGCATEDGAPKLASDASPGFISPEENEEKEKQEKQEEARSRIVAGDVARFIVKTLCDMDIDI